MIEVTLYYPWQPSVNIYYTIIAVSLHVPHQPPLPTDYTLIVINTPPYTMAIVLAHTAVLLLYNLTFITGGILWESFPLPGLA